MSYFQVPVSQIIFNFSYLIYWCNIYVIYFSSAVVVLEEKNSVGMKMCVRASIYFLSHFFSWKHVKFILPLHQVIFSSCLWFWSFHFSILWYYLMAGWCVYPVEYTWVKRIYFLWGIFCVISEWCFLPGGRTWHPISACSNPAIRWIFFYEAGDWPQLCCNLFVNNFDKASTILWR